MTSPSSVAPLFSDLRGVTVRNTFLEFEDLGADADFLPTSGFARQASEPAKPFNRQESEQTTAESGATAEENPTEPEEGYSQLASYLASALPQAAGAEWRGGRAHAPAADVSTSALRAAFQAAAAAPSPQAPPQAPQNQMGFPCFCPNCRAEAEPSHRFCPFCCYPLQMRGGAGGGGGGAAGAAQRRQQQQQQQCSPVGLEGVASPLPSAPNLLAYLRRFRFAEACNSDVELARMLCLSYMQTAKALNNP